MSGSGKQHLEIRWQRNAKFGDWAQLADGCYLLRSNLVGIDAATLFKCSEDLPQNWWSPQLLF